MTRVITDREILEARARELARPVNKQHRGQSEKQVPLGANEGNTARGSIVADSEELLRFRLARESYALETRFVHAVFHLAGITPLPGAQPPLYGVTAWRGDVLTILDLRSLLGAPVTALDDLSRVIVLGERRPGFGILADELDTIVSVGPIDIFPCPAHHSGFRDYLRGITRDATLVLDAARLLRQQADPT